MSDRNFHYLSSFPVVFLPVSGRNVKSLLFYLLLLKNIFPLSCQNLKLFHLKTKEETEDSDFIPFQRKQREEAKGYFKDERHV